MDPALGPPTLCEFEGVGVNVASLEHALELIAALIERRLSFFVGTLNLDHVVKLRRHAAFRTTYRSAALVTLDGAPLVALARRRGLAIARTTGADLVEPLCRLAGERRWGVFLVGPDAATNTRFADRFRVVTGNAAPLAAVAPSARFDPQGQEADAVLAQIAASGARICLVALGAPKQEFFCARGVERIQGVCFVPIGAAVEFMAGTRRRAPKLVQRAGMEWAWRLARQPRRLSGRYAACALAFLKLLAREKWMPVRASREQTLGRTSQDQS